MANGVVHEKHLGPPAPRRHLKQDFFEGQQGDVIPEVAASSAAATRQSRSYVSSEKLAQWRGVSRASSDGILPQKVLDHARYRNDNPRLPLAENGTKISMDMRPEILRKLVFLRHNDGQGIRPKQQHPELSLQVSIFLNRQETRQLGKYVKDL